MKTITLFLAVLFRLCRAWEYYGSVIFVTCLGLALARVDSPTQIVTALMANFLAAAFSFIFNDVEDAEDDKRDPDKAKRNPVAASLIAPSTVYLISILTAAVGIALYSLLGLVPLVFGLVSIILSFCYSWRLVRLKSKPVFDVVAHGLQLGTTQFLAAVTIKPFSMFPVVLLSILIFVMSVIADLNNEIRDHKTDQAAGLRNTLSVIDLKSWSAYVPLLWLGPISIILLFMLSIITITGRILILSSAVAAVVLYFSTPRRKRLEIFFYTRSQQLGTLWGMMFVLFR